MPAVRDQTVDGRELLPPAFVKMMEASLSDPAVRVTHDRIFAFLSTMPRKALPPWLWSIFQEIKDRRGMVELAGCYVQHGVYDQAHFNHEFRQWLVHLL